MKLNGKEKSADSTLLDKVPGDVELPESNITLDKIRADIHQLNSGTSENLFTIQSANTWIDQAKCRPLPDKLFDVFWFEGEVCILFADTNLGKSILAVQIADSITRGNSIPRFKLSAKVQKVIYFDFELSDKQFEIRYSEHGENHYKFSPLLQRAEINSNQSIPARFKSFEDFLHHSIEDSIQSTGAKILIIDNITYLKDETEKAKNALPLMKGLKDLKNKYNLSILILAHTPKRDQSRPISRNDIQGSKMLINFCDSAFAIGESSLDSNLRYLKQIKARIVERHYDSENVCICRIEKYNNFLHFQFMEIDREATHLRQRSESENNQLDDEIIAFHLSQPDCSFRKIAEELNTNHRRVGRVIKRYNQKNGK